jgi:hypothetical protein
MTIQEMHIAVNLGVQKIASFQVDNLLPQEIDYELNRAMDRFIKQRYAPMGNKYGSGFEQSQKRIDDLRNLVVDSKLESFYLGDTVGNGGEYFIDRAILPKDYLFYISSYLQIGHKCGKVLIPGIDVIYLTRTRYYISIPLSPPSPGYVLTRIEVNNTGATIISSNTELTFDELMNQNNYNSNYYPVDSVEEYQFYPTDSFHQTPSVNGNQLVLGNINVIPELKVTWALGETNAYLYYNQSNPSIVTDRILLDPGIQTSKVSLSYVQHDDIFDVLVDPFNTTKRSGPKFTIQENFIDTYTDNTFISNFVYLKYIRRPSRINIIAGVGCELAEHTHQEIVEIAVKSILGNIEDPRYNTQSREVLESE